MENEERLEIKVARLEERLVAADKAVELAHTALTAYQVSNNEWRQLMNDQRGQFVTVERLLGVSGIAVALATLISHFLK